jgi:hypothetical protein
MSIQLRFFAITGMLMFSLCTASAASAAYVDPPGRVARLEHTQGAVSYSPAGEDAWFSVVRNRPLFNGDRLWTDRGARAEFQVGSAAFRLGSNTSVEILDLSDRIAQVQLTQGTLNLSVRRIHPGQTYEVATPTLAFTINRAGRYRIDVDPRNVVTTIVAWEGAGVAYGENSRFPLRAGDTVRFYDADLRDYEMYGLPREDAFDRYCRERDRRLDRSASLRYLDDDVVGYADLDEYGSWRTVSSYGNVWFPSRVDADWAPYRDGHWAWQEPWGWTWVDDAPWGFAPSHYGRWVNVSNQWGWIPGPRNVRPVYAPALVAFIGGSGWSISLSFGGDSPIGWFPLGPREVYVPSYQASRDYFQRVNVNNTVINNTIITNVYNNYSSGTIQVNDVNYANRMVTGAVTAVPRNVFVNAQPVRQSALRLDRKASTTGEITRVAPIAPSVRSVIGSGKVVEARPSHEAIERRVFVRNAPPPGASPFAAREQQLQKNPGRAPEPNVVKSVQSRDDKTARNVSVIGEQHGAVDARAAGSRRAGDKPGTPSSVPGQLRPLDRSVEPAKEPGPGMIDHSRDKERKGQSDAKPQAEEQQQAERQRQAETQQQEQRQRKAVSEQKAAEQQQAERQRQAETQQQEQRQRKAVSEQKAAEQQQAERQRQAETQQQEQLQRKAASEQKAAEQQQAERQRQAEAQQQEQRQRKAASEQKAAEQQQADRQRQVEAQQQAERQRQAEAQQQEQRQRKAASDQKAAEQQQVERQRQAECERQAIQQHQDVSQCRSQTPPQEHTDSPNRDKNRK